jgi:D-arabinose 1-dehydrogenase-like Zn-dependent alcohol dehydrogenase
MATMRAAQVSRAGGAFEIVERAIPDPGPGEVRVKVEACGVCHSDSFVKEGVFPGMPYPRVPGHEVAGVVDAVGAGVVECGRRASASGSVGTAGTAGTATLAGGATSLRALTGR